MRRVTFTDRAGLVSLDYLCNLIPSTHYLHKRFVHAEVMLAAKITVRTHMRTIYESVPFYHEYEIRDLLEILGYLNNPPAHHIAFIDQYIAIADKIRFDEFKASRNFLGATNS